MKAIKIFADFFLPGFCFSCKAKLSSHEELLCRRCNSEILHASRERLNYEYSKKFTKEDVISDFLSLYVFEKDRPFQFLIHQLKYGSKFGIGLKLGKQIAHRFESTIKVWKADYIIPVPLHPVKKAERGYNQAFYIAKGIGRYLDMPVKENVIKRKRYTSTQTKLTLKERKENIKNAFEIKSSKGVAGKRIIIVDDVITTGATTSECAGILINSGAEKVFTVSAAIADD